MWDDKWRTENFRQVPTQEWWRLDGGYKDKNRSSKAELMQEVMGIDVETMDG